MKSKIVFIMDFFKVLEKRKAIRKYKQGKTISQKDINKILQYISLAPSARNLQSYKIFAVKSKTGINKVFSSCYNQRSDFIKNSALILIFCKDPEVSIENFGERGDFYSLQDATIACSYASLIVTALGYGSCWVGNFKESEIQKAINTKLKPVALLIIGYKDEKIERKERKPLTEIAKII